ncbi:PAS domain S-box protein [Desulfosarcina variabilis]|uniref:PAS domain-containing protein n=1 Tax=Desulfosarcina variabilis TaxID=2300 RepID=UPI003AFA4D0B
MAEPDGPFFLIAHQDITDLRLALDSLQKSEEKFSKAFHSAPVLMTISTIEEGRCLDLNDAFSRMTGFDREKAIGRTATELGLLKSEDRRQILANLNHDGYVRDFELEATRADGSKIFCYYSAVPIDVEGETRLLFIASDITGRKMAEKALRESERNFRMLADNVTDVIWSMDMNLKHTYISPSVKKLRGYTPEAAMQLPLENTFTPESYQKVIQTFSKEMAREGEPGVDPDRFIFLELDTIRKDGSIIPIEVNASFIRGDTGAPTGIIGTTRDITKRKQAEAALKESEERFKALHNASFGGIAIHDKGRIIECNKGLSEITGYAYQELIGMDGLSLISDDTREKVVLNISAGYEKPYEVNGVRKNGEVYPLRIEARNIPYKGKNVRVVEFRDLTETKRVEKEKENLEGQLLQSQKMEAVGKLAGGVAHDFNKMLSVIIGHAGLAMDDKDPNHPLYARLKQIKNAGERSAELTRQLLAFARKQTIAPKVLNLNKAVDGMIKMLQRLIGEDIDLGWKPGC